ncbi:tail fiber domain-containing protein [Microcoleus sp. AR_TQ3_B6]|uniref:tail fiber domain-containing protein n=1 Tax=Microcoleus sp. AR_TQ3_B6 TaxID=3055284 RepID=UPI002FD79BC6
MADQTIEGKLSVTDKIGIGINEPIAQLHISSSTAAPSQAFLESSGALLKLSVDASGAKLGTDNAFSLSIITDGFPRIAIDAVGNIGIGVPTPSTKLEVNGTIKATEFQGNGVTLDGIVKKSGDIMTGSLTVSGDVQATSFLGNGATLDGIVKKDGDTMTGPLTVQNNLTVVGNVTANQFVGNGSELTGIVGTTQWSNGTEEIIYYSGGNVGIGTNDPTARLHISDDFRGNLKLLATSEVGHDFGYDGGGDSSFWFAHFGAETGETLFRWEDGSSARDLLKIQNNGNVIGNFVQNSSKDLKENIHQLSSQEALQALAELSPVKFTYKADREKHQHIGFVAEDVPESIASSDKKGLGIMDIVGVLTQVLKEQQTTISLLTEKVKFLEVQIQK